MAKLSINLNKIALLRNSREGNFPNPADFANICIEHGCGGITLHPRPDQRHIRPMDVVSIGNICNNNPSVEFNIEGNPFTPARSDGSGLIDLIIDNKPDQATLVPDGDDQLTSDHGFDLIKDAKKLEPLILKLKNHGIRVSLFMNPDLEQIKCAKDIGADRIELYTGLYCNAFAADDKQQLKTQFQAHCNAAKAAQELGLGVNAGHDLNLQNLGHFLEIPNILEVSIGHAFTVESLRLGMQKTIQSYLQLTNRQVPPEQLMY